MFGKSDIKSLAYVLPLLSESGFLAAIASTLTPALYHFFLRSQGQPHPKLPQTSSAQ